MLFFQKVPDLMKLPFTLTFIILMSAVLYRAKLSARILAADTIQTTKQNVHAHGFGIANVKRVAEKHGGTCSLSQKDGWVQFTVLLPVSHKIS